MLALRDVSVRFGSTVAVDHVDLEIADGERLSVLGPSGSGKSTLLRAICGLEPLASGRVEWGGHDLAAVPVHRRGFGLMFQDYMLFPHLDVERNVRFGLVDAGQTRADIERHVAEAIELVRLRGYERRLPAQLSGGEQQRVALARAIAPRPRLLMLDEPLGALDRSLRRALLDELAEIFERLGLPIVYVTHDHEEAMAVGDRVAVMRAGRIEAVMSPRDLWRAPPSEFVARFLGMSNVVTARMHDGRRAETPFGTIVLAEAGDGDAVDGESRLLLRPDAFRPARDGELDVVVRASSFRGDHAVIRVAPAQSDGSDEVLEIEADWMPEPAVGDRLRLTIEPSGVVRLPLP